MIYTFCGDLQSCRYHATHMTVSTGPNQPPATKHHKAPNSTSQDPPKTKNHHTPRHTAQPETQRALQVECTGLALIDWGAQALPNCADNIVAETHGAELAISLYEKYRQLCQQQSFTPLPLDRIQGDIKPLLQHLDFRGRFRRNDLINLVHQFHAKRSRIAPDSITEYRPREANALADYFAGQASAWLLQTGNTQIPTSVPFSSTS